jgi:hypothetical protein
MTRPLINLNQIILVLIVIGMGVLPLYGQQTSQTVIFEDAAEMGHDGPCFGPSESQRTARRGYAIEKERASLAPVKGVRLDLSKAARLEFKTNAAETPALPVSESSLQSSSQTTNQTKSKQDGTEPYVFPTRKERFDRYVRSMFGPTAFLRSAINAGINQWKDSPEEWEQGMSGYGKRFASSFGKNAVQHTVIYGLDSALGLDTGFRRSPSKKFGERLKHALLENITSRTKSGKRVISVPRIAGAYTSGVVSREAWYPERYNYKDGLRSGTRSLLTGFALNVVREFVVKF